MRPKLFAHLLPFISVDPILSPDVTVVARPSALTDPLLKTNSIHKCPIIPITNPILRVKYTYERSYTGFKASPVIGRVKV